jgi:hypothetical protein
MVRLAGAEPATGCDAFRMPAHLAFCASAILRREAADTVWVFWVDFWETPIPFKDSIPKIIWFNFSTSDCARSRFSRSFLKRIV